MLAPEQHQRTANVRFGSLADMLTAAHYVRLLFQIGHTDELRLSAIAFHFPAPWGTPGNLTGGGPDRGRLASHKLQGNTNGATPQISTGFCHEPAASSPPMAIRTSNAHARAAA